ncbi:MFS transporter [Humibacter antri]
MPHTKNDRLPPAFVKMAWSSVLALSADQIALAATPLAAVLLLGADASVTATLQATQTLPFLLLALPAGVAADRMSRRRLLIAGEVVRVVSVAAIVMLLVAQQLTVPLLAVLSFSGAVGTVALSVAGPAMTPSLVSRERLSDANRWLEVGRSAAYVGGPALAGALVSVTGAPAAFVAAVVICVAGILLLVRLPQDAPLARERRHPLGEVVEGAAFVVRHPLLRPIIVIAILFNVAWFVLQGVYVAYAVHTMGFSAAVVGLTLGVYGAGMVVGAFAARWVLRRFAFGLAVAVGPLSGMVAALIMVCTLWFPSPVLAGAAFFLFGAGPVLWTISTTTLRQTVTPANMLGRVSALVTMATYGARPIGAIIGGLVASWFGVQECLIVAAAGFVIQFVCIGVSALPRLRVIPEAVEAVG